MSRNTGNDRPAGSGTGGNGHDHLATPGSLRMDARQRWVDLTDHDLNDFEGQADRLSNALRTRYGWSEEEIDEEIRSWEQDRGTGMH